MAEFASKAAEKAAKDLNEEEIAAITGTGKGGAITKKDIDAAKAPADEKPKAKAKAERKLVERIRTHNQAWIDPFSGEEVLLNGGVPSSGARIVGADGEPVTTLLNDSDDYYAVIG